MAATLTDAAAGQRAVTYPLLYEVYARAALTARARALGRAATLDDVPDADLDRLAALGFDWVWLLGVWQTGAAGATVSRSSRTGGANSSRRCPTCAEEDIRGSPFAIAGYTVHERLRRRRGAGAAARRACASAGLRLMLDFVPNHTALDHPWVDEHPEYYVHGSEDDLAREPQQLSRAWRHGTGRARCWPTAATRTSPAGPTRCSSTTATAGLREAMIGELARHRRAVRRRALRHGDAAAARRLRADLGRSPRRTPFWPDGDRGASGRGHPDFVFMAEVYWDLEWALQQQGFDYTYDKRLYDRLRDGTRGPVRDHLRADRTFQDRSARFLENHDEPRAAATFPPEVHAAAAVVTFLSPGPALLPRGAVRGPQGAHLDPPRPPAREPVDRGAAGLLRAAAGGPAAARGARRRWRLLDAAAAWDGNDSWDGFIAFAWGDAGQRLLVAVN